MLLQLRQYFALLLILAIPMASFAEEEETALDVYGEVTQLFQTGKWGELLDEALYYLDQYPDSPFTQDVKYFSAIGFYHIRDYEYANDYLSDYLKESKAPKYFDQAIYHKFLIADEFRNGAKKRMFKWQKSPVYLSALDDALDIYDEVISTLPYHELAAKALYGKGMIQSYYQDFKEGADTFHHLIRKFPKHELAIESYLELGNLYLKQCKAEHLDPNLLDHAVNDVQKFEKAFPGEERLKEARDILAEMKEAYAHNLYETGKFYERTNKKNAAIIYYKKVLAKFPSSNTAKDSSKRLKVLDP